MCLSAFGVNISDKIFPIIWTQ